MFPSISIKHDVDVVARWARGMAGEQLPFATALALTKTGQDVKARLEREMGERFDKPTPYTRRAFRLIPATKTDLRAVVTWREDARNYLAPQVYAGQRRAKALETALRAAGHLPAGWFAVPGAGARLDPFGNMDRGQVIQVLSQLRITMTAGYTRNMSFANRKAIAAQRKAGGRFFVIKPDAGHGQPGVYQREFSGRNISPVVIFVRSAVYRVRLPMQQITQDVVAQRFEPNFIAALERARATAR